MPNKIQITFYYYNFKITEIITLTFLKVSRLCFYDNLSHQELVVTNDLIRFFSKNYEVTLIVI